VRGGGRRRDAEHAARPHHGEGQRLARVGVDPELGRARDGEPRPLPERANQGEVVRSPAAEEERPSPARRREAAQRVRHALRHELGRAAEQVLGRNSARCADDSVEPTLAEGVAAFSECLGRRPTGYRAHTYRLTRPLFDALRDLGFGWDSSLMRAYAQGRNRHPAFALGDYLVFDGAFVELPIATWRGTSLPFNHTHLLLASRPGELLLRSMFGPGRLVAYNCHMTDLVRCDSLKHAVRTRTVRMLHWYLWSGRGQDTFGVLSRVIRDLQLRGYACRTSELLWLDLLAAEQPPGVVPS